MRHDIRFAFHIGKIRDRLVHLFDRLGKNPLDMGYGRVWFFSLSTLVFPLLKGKLSHEH